MNRPILLLLCMFLLPLSIFAQEADSVSLSSPHDALYTHLKYLQPESYKPEIAARVFPVEDGEEAQSLAIKLKQIYDGKGLYLRLNSVPRNPNYMDSTVMKHRYAPFPKELPQIYLVKKGEKWFYSDESINEIPKLYKEVYPFGSDLLANLFPGLGQKKVLGLFVWQYLGIILFIIAIILFHFILTRVIRWVFHRIERRFSKIESSLPILLKIARPIAWMIMTLLVLPFLPMLQLPISVNHYIVLIIRALTPFFLMLSFYRSVDLLSHYLSHLATLTDSKMDDQLVPLASKALKVLVVIIGLLYILQNLNVDITTLLAGISIGGIAIALAAQDTLKNFFGSVMIFLDKPFQIGDVIDLNGMRGTVEDVGFRSTRIRTFENSLLYVPNGQLADSVIDNYGLREFRLFKIMISITYDTPPILIEKFTDGLKKIIEDHPNTRKENWHVRFNAMSSSSLDILMFVYFIVPDWAGELKAREDILISTVELAEELGVRFAFPTSTIHVEELPGAGSLSPKYDTDEEVLNKKIAAFMQSYRQRIQGQENA